MAERTPLPPESPDECISDTPENASTATCSTTSASGDHPSTFRRPTRESSTPLGGIPGVDEYVTGMETTAAETGLTAFTRPKVTATRQGKKFIPMEGKALEIAGRLKEMFHGYTNRMERNQQATLGPSEIGSPCDRRLAMSLLRFPPVNSGGDNWASFVGTCTHAGLADMFVWANAGSGRYHPEVALAYPAEHVPKGTTDLIDTTLCMVMDHKLMGGWSLDKLRTSGPSDTYRVQAHTYGYGAKLKGFDIKDVAIIAWPRERGTLDELYVWTEPYDPDVARQALARVEQIAELVISNGDPEADGMAYENFPIDNSDCRYCPYLLKGAPNSEGGVCNGRE